MFILASTGVAQAQTRVSVCTNSTTLTSQSDYQNFVSQCAALGGTTRSGAQTSNSVVAYCDYSCNSQSPTGAGAGNTTSNGNLSYTPLEPLPNGPTSYTGSTNLSAYLSQMYRIAVTVGGLLAVVFLVVGGIRYMLAEAGIKIQDAKDQMYKAVWGLLIVVGSYLVLWSINPALVQFNLSLPNSPTTTATNTVTTNTATQTFTSASQNTSLDGTTVNQDNCNIVKDASGGFWNAQSWSGLMLSLRSNFRSTFTDTTQAQMQQASQDFLAACAQQKFI